MTDETLKAISSRAERATEGPWRSIDGQIGCRDRENGCECHGFGIESDHRIPSLVANADFEGITTGILRRPDATFIAHAREDVPALVEEVRRLRAELAEVRRVRDQVLNYWWPRLGYSCANEMVYPAVGDRRAPGGSGPDEETNPKGRP